MKKHSQNERPDGVGADDDPERSPFSRDALGVETAGPGERAVDDAHHAAWQRLSTALRRAMVASIDLGSATETLTSLADQAETLADALEHGATGRSVPLFGPGDESDPALLSARMPFSPVSGAFNPVAPPLRVLPHGPRAHRWW